MMRTRSSPVLLYAAATRTTAKVDGARNRLHPGSCGGDAGGRRDHDPVSAPAPAGAAGLHPGRCADRPAYAGRAGRRRAGDRRHLQPRRGAADVHAGAGVQRAQAARSRHGRVAGGGGRGGADAVDRFRHRQRVRLEGHGCAVSRGDHFAVVDHGGDPHPVRAWPAPPAVRATGGRAAGGRGHAGHRDADLAHGGGDRRFSAGRSRVHPNRASGPVRGGRHDSGPAAAAAAGGLRGGFRSRRNPAGQRARDLLRRQPAGSVDGFSVALGAFLRAQWWPNRAAPDAWYIWWSPCATCSPPCSSWRSA